MTPNHVKQRIRNGRPAFGSLLNFGDPLVAEMMASVGFDWLLVDTEHGPIDMAALATMFATITRYPCAPFVRVPVLSEDSVKRVLDAGAWGVLAPNIRTRAEAELLVRSCKYPPQGTRSLGAGRFPLSFKTDAPTYFAARQRRDPGHRADRAPRGDQEHRRHPLGARRGRLLRRAQRLLRLAGAGALAGAAAQASSTTRWTCSSRPAGAMAWRRGSTARPPRR